MKKVYSFTRNGVDFEVFKDNGWYTIVASKNNIVMECVARKNFGDAYRSMSKMFLF